MSRLHPLAERHAVEKLGWLRAAVLGANDGTLSTGSLIVGVASSHATRGSILVAGLSALVAGALSMAAGEYVSVSSQADSEHADIAREKQELVTDWEGEVTELAGIYQKRGLDKDLSRKVAVALMKHDALGAHAQGMNWVCPKPRRHDPYRRHSPRQPPFHPEHYCLCWRRF
ncbi:hypothetical protein NBRC3222_0839 [Acetobacter pasteurianus NBRC 3222]|nr:hypothetical protein NBRC3222_0839 [Acetobacter pasteurianus NBRC 3222]